MNLEKIEGFDKHELEQHIKKLESKLKYQRIKSEKLLNLIASNECKLHIMNQFKSDQSQCQQNVEVLTMIINLEKSILSDM